MIPENSQETRIVIITCYFGNLPNYFPLVSRSIAENIDIDWHLFTDDQTPRDYPPNLFVHYTNLESIADRISEAGGINVTLTQPYQICSLRPAFGLAFHDVVKNYHFWAYCDIDLIFGNIRSFLPSNIMDYGRVFVRGHLSLYRNITDVNRAFLLDAPGALSYKEVASKVNISWQFDEWPGIWKIFRYHRIPQYHAEVIADIKPPNWKHITRFEAEELPNHPHQVFYWHGGKTFQAYYHREGGLFDHEVAYVHFQKRAFPEPDANTIASPGFLIGPAGFTPYDRENLSPVEMDRLNGDIPRSLKERLGLWVRRLGRALDKRRTLRILPTRQ
jgi:hypothetical protein